MDINGVDSIVCKCIIKDKWIPNKTNYIELNIVNKCVNSNAKRTAIKWINRLECDICLIRMDSRLPIRRRSQNSIGKFRYKLICYLSIIFFLYILTLVYFIFILFSSFRIILVFFLFLLCNFLIEISCV